MFVCMLALIRYGAEMGVYLAAVLGSPSGMNAGVGLQQFLNECDGKVKDKRNRGGQLVAKIHKQS